MLYFTFENLCVLVLGEQEWLIPFTVYVILYHSYCVKLVDFLEVQPYCGVSVLVSDNLTLI